MISYTNPAWLFWNKFSFIFPPKYRFFVSTCCFRFVSDFFLSSIQTQTVLYFTHTYTYHTITTQVSYFLTKTFSRPLFYSRFWNKIYRHVQPSYYTHVRVYFIYFVNDCLQVHTDSTITLQRVSESIILKI